MIPKPGKIVYLLLLLGILAGCRKKTAPVSSNQNSRILISVSKKYMGTPYKFGGIDDRGMDCSGLVYASFLEMGIKMPRISWQQSDYFREIEKKNVREGDLVYFRISSKKINHTGIITKKVSDEEILFIHSSTSKGVREDNLLSKFWWGKFVKATRPQF